ncbi:hypothetical protein O3P69_008008 [Scylla paramamosain]|uniref:Uncharacterized protein n=1 Tax=Scylla paramamosain TaxID=85552 RepID=A0AAW0T1C2_SCYPA
MRVCGEGEGRRGGLMFPQLPFAPPRKECRPCDFMVVVVVVAEEGMSLSPEPSLHAACRPSCSIDWL